MVVEAKNKYVISERLLAHCFLMAVFLDEHQNCHGRDKFLEQIKPHIQAIANNAGFFLTQLAGARGNTKRADQMTKYSEEIFEGAPRAFNY